MARRCAPGTWSAGSRAGAATQEPSAASSRSASRRQSRRWKVLAAGSRRRPRRRCTPTASGTVPGSAVACCAMAANERAPPSTASRPSTTRVGRVNRRPRRERGSGTAHSASSRLGIRYSSTIPGSVRWRVSTQIGEDGTARTLFMIGWTRHPRSSGSVSACQTAASAKNAPPVIPSGENAQALYRAGTSKWHPRLPSPRE